MHRTPAGAYTSGATYRSREAEDHSSASTTGARRAVKGRGLGPGGALSDSVVNEHGASASSGGAALNGADLTIKGRLRQKQPFCYALNLAGRSSRAVRRHPSGLRATQSVGRASRRASQQPRGACCSPRGVRHRPRGAGHWPDGAEGSPGGARRWPREAGHRPVGPIAAAMAPIASAAAPAVHAAGPITRPAGQVAAVLMVPARAGKWME